MNSHLNNWLDKAEGKKEGSSNAGIKKEMKRQGYGSKGKALSKAKESMPSSGGNIVDIGKKRVEQFRLGSGHLAPSKRWDIKSGKREL